MSGAPTATTQAAAETPAPTGDAYLRYTSVAAMVYLFFLFCQPSAGLPRTNKVMAKITPEMTNALPAPPPPAAVVRDPVPALPEEMPPSPDGIRTYVATLAGVYGIDPERALWILDHESQDGRNMRGDANRSKGYWMISATYHPEVSQACADSLQCSTRWAMKRIARGHIKEWTTYKYCRKWYPLTCPF